MTPAVPFGAEKQKLASSITKECNSRKVNNTADTNLHTYLLNTGIAVQPNSSSARHTPTAVRGEHQTLKSSPLSSIHPHSFTTWNGEPWRKPPASDDQVKPIIDHPLGSGRRVRRDTRRNLSIAKEIAKSYEDASHDAAAHFKLRITKSEDDDGVPMFEP